MSFFTASLLTMISLFCLSLILTLGWYALKRTQKTWGGR